MRAVAALLVSMTMTTAGCFPHNEQHRTYAKIGEGTALVAGIAISAFSNSGADCDEYRAPGTMNTDCRSNAKLLSTIGVTLILAGLLGFVATVSTAEDEAKAPPQVVQTPPDKPAAGTGSGSAQPTN